MHDPVDRAACNDCAELLAVLVGVDQEDGTVGGVKQVRLLSVRHVDGKAGTHGRTQSGFEGGSPNPAGGLGGAVSSPAGFGAEPRKILKLTLFKG